MKESNTGWLLDYFRGKDVTKNEPLVNELFCDDSRKEELKKLLSVQFHELISEPNAPEKDLDHILYRIHYSINSSSAGQPVKSRRTQFLIWSARVAAMIILPLLIFWAARGFIRYEEFDNAVAEIHAPAWTRTSFTLPDGSTGWLNSNSTLKYKVNFRKERHVELTGEAFFDVQKDSKNPFTVDAGDVSVKVHGTKFNVSSWEDENNIEVVLSEGIIELISDDSDSSFILKPHELALYDRKGGSFTTAEVESNKYLSWTEGKLVFRNDPLDVVGRRLERWYNVDVEISGSFADDFRLRATFVDESLEEVLDWLSKSLNIAYSVEEKEMSSDNTYGRKKVKLYAKKK